MNKMQEIIFQEIQEEKAKEHPDKKRLKQLAHTLTSYDNREPELRRKLFSDPGGRSRSPSLGLWHHDDEFQPKEP